MTKGKKTTLDERIEIVSFCVEHGKDYQLTIQEYGVSYNQIYSWVRKYEEKGASGLIDNRGRKKPESEMDENERLKAENRLLRAENRRLEVELAVRKKIKGTRKEATLSGVCQEDKYLAIVELKEEMDYTVAELCRALSLPPASYYKWKKRKKSARELENEQILREMVTIYEEYNKTYGYRRIMDEYNEIHGTHYNKKRFHRLAKLAGLHSVIRRKRPAYQYHAAEQTAENILARDFTAENPNEKWLTDVTEMEYGNGQKLYVSAVLDLKANDIVAYTIGKSNNNCLVFTNFDLAIQKYPDAHPLFHSDRGFQYTNKSFKAKLDAAGVVQSMSRKGKCIDNGPIEGFWGILKTEMYYLNTFDDYESLEKAIEDFIYYYNNKRRQRRLDRLPPLEYRRKLEMRN